ncbi:MAG: guanylate kinase [Clostridium sp.]
MNKLFVFVGPSGAGKTLISRFLVQNNIKELDELISTYNKETRVSIQSNLNSISASLNNLSLRRIITSTSRLPREGELNNVDYHFYSREVFMDKIESGDFLEHVVNFNNYYGTCFDAIHNSLELGSSIIVLDDDGAIKMKELLGSSVVTIYLDIPLHVMEDRMNYRHDDVSSVKDRLCNIKITAFKEIADFVINSNNRIDYVLLDVFKIIDRFTV